MTATITLIGFLNKEPKITRTDDGVLFAKFSLIVERPNIKSTDKRTTDVFNVTAWRAEAEYCEKNLKVGSGFVVVNGRVQTNCFTNLDGGKCYGIETIASTVRALDSKSGENNG